jgi:hypothetical protein
MLIDGHFEGSSTRSSGRSLSLLDRITTPHYRFGDQFEGSSTRRGSRTLSLLDRITPRGPRGSGLGECSLRDRQHVGAHHSFAEGQERRRTASRKKFSKRGRSRTYVCGTMTRANC